MPIRVHKPPVARLHKPSGQARIRHDGREIYLGKWGSAEARKRYAAFLEEWRARQAAPLDLVPSQALTISVAVVRFHEWARQRYRHPDGTSTRTADNLKSALRPLRRLYGALPVAQFGPAKLYELQGHLVAEGLSRSTINCRIGHVRRFFKWLVGRELAPATILAGLDAVEAVRAGQGARETPRRRPVAWETVAATLPHLTPMLRDLVVVLWHTGCRVGEVRRLTTGDIDQSGDVWRATLGQHKTAHHGHARIILLGPEAQNAIRPWLRPEHPAAAIFEPSRVSERAANNHGERAPGDTYSRVSLPQALRRAIRKANTPKPGQAPPTPIPAWTLAQLRHSAATRIREQHGIDVAATVLGHSRPDMTAHYSGTAINHAVDAVRKGG